MELAGEGGDSLESGKGIRWSSTLKQASPLFCVAAGEKAICSQPRYQARYLQEYKQLWLHLVWVEGKTKVQNN